MAYPRKLLTDNEEVIREFRPHWRMLFVPMLWVLLGAVAIGLVWTVIPVDGIWPLILTVLVMVALLPLAAKPFIDWWFTSYVLTNERLITRAGVVARQGIEIPLENINNVLFSQNVVERVLKSGDLLIESAGESGQSRFSDIPDPEQFQALLYRTREQRTALLSGAGPPASAPPDAMDRLAKLDELYRSGVITEEEYAAKKAKLLDEI
ncbi:MAG TPA: PH domain-containing protein [Acidimicrobiia bacterium]|jgi:uncharacterized membrane protein YdbT with pleckstrin-like domain|nr:PH domain-containing protein [Acidimicrobiia bacterium]